MKRNDDSKRYEDKYLKRYKFEKVWRLENFYDFVGQPGLDSFKTMTVFFVIITSLALEALVVQGILIASKPFQKIDVDYPI